MLEGWKNSHMCDRSMMDQARSNKIIHVASWLFLESPDRRMMDRARSNKKHNISFES